MKLSIIIPVRNEETLIKKIIDQLENKLKISSYEIIFNGISKKILKLSETNGIVLTKASFL